MNTNHTAISNGFTREVLADASECTLELLIKPDTDLDGRFKAWDLDAQAFIYVNGWLFSVEDVEG